MSKQRPQSSLTGSLLAAYEEHKKPLSQRIAENAAVEKQTRKSELQRMVDSGVAQGDRWSLNKFDNSQDRRAHAYLTRFEKKLFDYRNYEKRHINFGSGIEECYLPTVKKRYQRFFELAKDTKGFLGFIVWTYKYNAEEKRYTAQLVLEELGWVLRYGRDKQDVYKDLDAVDPKDYYTSKHTAQPSFAHSLTTPLGYVNERTKRSLEQKRHRRDANRVLNKVARRTTKNWAKVKGEVANLNRLVSSEAVQRDLVKRDAVIRRYMLIRQPMILEASKAKKK